MKFRPAPALPLLLILLGTSLPVTVAESARVRGDLDRDGLNDALEQVLLDQFVPAFQVSRRECAGLPSEFEVGSRRPVPTEANGTIYGQAFPVKPAHSEGAFVELHYYHLWDRDCGAFGHRLDAEYVSALLRADAADSPAGAWRAVYWYAAAHEGTLCDASNAARAKAVQAETRGPKVWISEGKHASFLSRKLCSRIGCGGDRCEDMRELPAREVVNVGEPARPMNGALWINDSGWPLPSKLEADFDDTSLEPFSRLDPSVADFMNGSLPPTKAFLLAGNRTIESLMITNAQTRSALSTAGEEAGGASKVGLGSAVRSVWRSLRAAGRWLVRDDQ
jgi:hypothetical protein